MDSRDYKIGVGIITCNRLDYLKKLIDTLVPCRQYIDELIIINDGQDIPTWSLPFGTWSDNEKNLGVGKSKNRALKYLFDKGCDFLFVIEDDMLIKNPIVFQQYVKASKVSGIQHFNYGPGSPFNRKQNIQFDLHNRHLLDQNSEPNPKMILDYGNCIKISLFEHTVAMFSFFTREVLEKVGLYDETYYNAWEHVDHTYMIIKAGFHPPFWWFADLYNSHEYITEAPEAINNSSIANNNEQWHKNVYGGREIYKLKHGHYPNEPPFTSKNKVVQILKNLKPKA